mgnify:CR=1 FL=1
MRQEIEDFRVERGIPYFLHFTRAENLSSILANGLMPRSEMDKGNCCGVTNDELRLDNRRDFNCLSATFPNSKMFYRFRSDHPDTEWPILVINPRIISQRHTLFCWENAASSDISCADERQLSSLAAFQDLFAERDGHPTRVEQFLQNSDPTHVQAEFLVKGTIPASAIYCVIFPSVPCQNEHAEHVGERQSIVSSRRGFYGTRQYFRQWGDGKNG